MAEYTMNIMQMMQAGANVQVVVSVTDLKELFNELLEEREALKAPPKEDRLLSADEAASIFHVTSVTLWRWAKNGYLKPIKVGRKVHYWQSSIDNFLKQKEGEV